MFKLSKLVSATALGPNGRLSLRAALDFMMDCSCFQMDHEPVLSAYFEQAQVGVFLASRQFELLRQPELGENLQVVSSVYQCRHFYGYRNTVIYDEAGRICCQSYSIGAFVHLPSGKPHLLPAAITAQLHFDKPLDMQYLPRKIATPQVAGELVGELKVPYCFLDANRHVNSNKYVILAAEFLPEHPEVKRFRIEYANQSKLGEQLSIKRYSLEPGHWQIEIDNLTTKLRSASVEFWT